MRYLRLLGVLAVACGAAALITQDARAARSLSTNPISATEGQSFSGVVATIDDSCREFSDAEIEWGDGRTSPTDGQQVTLIADTNPNVCDVEATHTYAEEGKYTTVIVLETVGAREFIAAPGTATVADAPLGLAAQTLTATAGVALNGSIATLTDDGGLEPASNYTIAIDWGDGHSSAGTVDSSGHLNATNTYATAGTFTFTVTVDDEGGSTASTTGTVTVVSPAASTPPPRACNALPSTASSPFTPSGGTPNQRYLQGLYHDLLNRPADPTSLSLFGQALDLGTTRAQVVLAIENSAEYRSDLMNSFYSTFLGRSADASSLSTLIGLLQGGETDEQVLAQIVGSPEYFQNRAGGTNAGFLDALYCDALGRHADPSSLQTFGQALTGGQTRVQIAQAIFSSAEYRQDIVRDWYLRFLRRQADPAGLSALIGLLGASQSDEQVLAGLLSSPEYYAMFNPTASAIGAVQVNAGGVIHVTLAHSGTIDLSVYELLPAVRKANASPPGAPTIAPPRVRRIGMVHFGRHKAGPVTLHWNRRVSGQRLRKGHYLLVLRLHGAKKLSGVSDSVNLTVR